MTYLMFVDPSNGKYYFRINQLLNVIGPELNLIFLGSESACWCEKISAEPDKNNALPIT